MNRFNFLTVCTATLLLGVMTAAIGQTSNSQRSNSQTARSATTDSAAAEREKIWNSPTMLRARAWVQEYCQRSAKITPAEAKAYMNELENLSPMQMKLWLLKYEHEEAMIRQQQADFNRTRQAGVAQSMSVDRTTQQDYADINRDENEAAAAGEQSLNTQQQQAAARGAAKQSELNAAGTTEGGYFDPFGGYGYDPLGGYGYGYGGPHIHVHVYPQ